MDVDHRVAATASRVKTDSGKLVDPLDDELVAAALVFTPQRR